MAGKTYVTLEGLGEVKTMLRAGTDDTISAIKEALYAEAQVVLRESKRQVPFRTGALSSSGMVHEPYAAGSKAAVEISYGGAAIDYALEQHENLTYRHAAGRKAKYLEDPAVDATERLGARLRERVARMLKKRGYHDSSFESWME